MEHYLLEKLIASDSLIVELSMAFLRLVMEMRTAGNTLYISLIAAFVISALVVWLLRFVAKNVTESYQPGIGFTISSFISYIATFVLVICLFSLQFTEPVVRVVIKGWELALTEDIEWRNSTFLEAYEKVADLRTEDGRSVEDFNGFPHPDLGGSNIPARSDQARFAITDAYLVSAAENFEETMPVLNWILSAKTGNAKSEILSDMERYFEGSQTYELLGAVSIAGDKIADELIEQTGRIIIIGTAALLLVWFVLQTLIFALVSWAALRRIKEDFC